MTRNLESNKKPILLLGCSYVHNSHFSFDNSNRSSDVIAKYTGRPVYNRSKDGFGPPAILFQLENDDFYKTMEEPEYIIYTFIGDHVRRMYLPANLTLATSNDIMYKLKNNKLHLVERKSFHQYFLLPLYLKYILYKYNLFPYNQTFEERSRLLLKYMSQIKENVNKHWKNTKFVIFVYDNESPTIKYLQKDLEKLGFIVIYRMDIAPFDEKDVEYCSSATDTHPNPNAWATITPKLIQEIEKY